MKTHQNQNIIKFWKMRKRKNKTHFIKKKKKCVQSSQEKWKCITKDKRVSRRNTNSSRKDGSLSNWKENLARLKTQKGGLGTKKKKTTEPSRLKTRKGGLGKIRAKSKQKKNQKNLSQKNESEWSNNKIGC